MTFAEEFAKSQGQPISVGGQEIVPMLRRTVLPGCRILVVWRSARLQPVQGIRIKIQGGKLSMGNTSDLNDVVLWRDTAADETAFVCHAKKTAELRVWNCWRDDRGVMQAWVGNAAMRVIESGSNAFLIECNARQDVTFSDLVFSLTFERNAPPDESPGSSE